MNSLRKKIIVRFMLMLLGVFSMALVSACHKSDKKELHQYVKEVKARSPFPIEPIPQPKQYPGYKYPDNHERSPFVALRPRHAKTGTGPDENRLKEPLELFPLDSLRMVGTLDELASQWVLIAAPDGTVYRATVGNYIGQNYGHITKIMHDRVEVVETVPDQDGWRERPTSIALVEEQTG